MYLFIVYFDIWSFKWCFNVDFTDYYLFIWRMTVLQLLEIKYYDDHEVWYELQQNHLDSKVAVRLKTKWENCIRAQQAFAY